MATYGALERMMVYMITKSENRKCLGPATRPHSKGVSDVWKSQRKETCFDRDGTLFPDFGKEAPSEKNFRLNVERLVENAMILLDVPVPCCTAAKAATRGTTSYCSCGGEDDQRSYQLPQRSDSPKVGIAGYIMGIECR